jgi:hypothetical protein
MLGAVALKQNLCVRFRSSKEGEGIGPPYHPKLTFDDVSFAVRGLDRESDSKQAVYSFDVTKRTRVDVAKTSGVVIIHFYRLQKVRFIRFTG